MLFLEICFFLLIDWMFSDIVFFVFFFNFDSLLMLCYAFNLLMAFDNLFSQPFIYIDGWLYGMRMTSVVCNVPVLSQNASTYHHSVFTT